MIDLEILSIGEHGSLSSAYDSVLSAPEGP